MGKENDLSDIVWTACVASLPFKRFLINFFFPKRFTDDEIRNIGVEREKSVGVGRPDFFFYVNADNLSLSMFPVVRQDAPIF